MIPKIFSNKFLQTIVIIVLAGSVTFGQEADLKRKATLIAIHTDTDAQDLVNGNLVQFSDNGAWCWYQDERVVVDVAGGKLVVGSVASRYGVGGLPRDGDINAILFDLESGRNQRFTLKHGYTSYGGGDDHNAPAFLVRPDGKYLVVYAGHNNDNFSRYHIYDGSSWSEEQQFDWDTMPGGSDFQTTYSNLFYLSAEERVYNIARTDSRSPNLMVSGDQGNTWSYGGQLTEPDITIGYVNGYFKYATNGIDRIDFIATEHHPRDFNTSIYHGYIQDGKSYTTDGILLDDDITDKAAPNPDEYTQVFAANTVVSGVTMTRCWTIDLQVYDDGTLGAIFKARANNSEFDHRFFYARYDGNQWNSSYLGKAGPKLFAQEQDYTGLGALDPSDPSTVIISTSVDPRDDTDLGVHEIFKGVTGDNGVTWTWTPITEKSTRDNLRPIVPAWGENNTALLWWRGTYNFSQSFDAAVVGILQHPSEIVAPKSYVDATAVNTLRSDGSPLAATGPNADRGAADNQWHQRTGFGNGGSVLTSAEIGGENAPIIKTQVPLPEAGTYDVWINFWANPTADWRIQAGFSASAMQLFRQMACQQVEDGDHDITLVLTGSGNTFLYQAYLGRVHAPANHTFEVFVDDEAIKVGTQGTLIGDVARTWYDGISYARFDNDSITSVSENKALPIEFSLSQNYPNPFNSNTTITYSLSKDAYVHLKLYNIIGQEIATLVNKEMLAGTYSIVWNAQNVPSCLYFYKITVGNFSKTNKMMLLK